MSLGNIFLGPEIFFFFVLFLFTLCAGLLLTKRGCRRFIILLMFLSVVVSIGKIYAIQQTPQWHDTPLDAKTNEVHGIAFGKHWLGHPVESLTYELSGLVSTQQDVSSKSIWRPQDNKAYTSVLGSREWLYSAFLGWWSIVSDNWQQWAIYSNAIFIAFFPCAVYGIAILLNLSSRAATVASMLTLADPISAVTGAWLLRDSMAGFLTMLALWSLCSLVQKTRLRLVILVGLSFGLLGVSRFVIFCALAIVIFIIWALFIKNKDWQRGILLKFAVALGLLFYLVMFSFPNMPTIHSFGNGIVTPLKGQVDLLAESHCNKDISVSTWCSKFSYRPFQAMIVAVTRTLFAPYPWGVIKTGLTYNNYIELYLLGNFLYFLCLPFILIGLVQKIKLVMQDYSFTPLSLIIIILCAVYVVFMGEWSTRQRGFMNQVFFLYTIFGAQYLVKYIKKKSVQ